MSQEYIYPASSASVNISAIGANGAAAPTTSIQVGAKDPSNNLQPLKVNGAGSLLVDFGGTTGIVTANQGTPNTAANGWPVKITDGTNILAVSGAGALSLPTGASTSALQTTGNTSLASIDTKTPALVTGRVPVDGSGVTQPVSGTVTANQGGTWNINNISGTISLPTGAATETTLAAMSAKLPASLGIKTSALSLSITPASDALFRILDPDSAVTGNITAADAVVPAPAGTGAFVSGASTTGSLVALQMTGGDSSWDCSLLGTLSGTYYFEESIDSTTGTDGNWISVIGRQTGVATTTLATSTTVSGLFRGNSSAATWFRVRNVGGTGLATAIKITASSGVGAVFLNASLPSGTNTIGKVNTNSPVNTNGSNVDATVSTVITLTAPANSVGFILMNLDTSTASFRWRIGATATASSGQQMQPGRDTGFVPCAANISICAESGTQNYNIQWVLSA